MAMKVAIITLTTVVTLFIYFFVVAPCILKST